jgi:hypothetical protein
VGNDKVPTVKYSVSDQINAQEEAFAIQKKFGTIRTTQLYIKRDEIGRNITDPSAGITALEDLLGEIQLADSKLLDLKRQAERVVRIEPAASQILTDIDREIKELVAFRKRIETTIEKLKELIAKNTTA